MKKSVAITAVLSFHAAVIGILLAQAGCSSDPAEPVTQAKTTVGEPAQVKTTNEQVNETFKEKDEVVLPPEGSPALRADPTRPIQPAQPVVAESSTSINDEVKVEPEKTTDEKLAVYIVQKGDFPARIAKKHGVSTSELLKVNGLSKNTMLKIGQKLKIPANGIIAPAETETVKSSVSQKDVSPSTESEVYTVVRGDSLSRIAKRYSMSVKQLMSINNLKSHNIRIGQKLHVTKGSAKTAESKSASVKTKDVVTAEGEVKYTVKSGDYLGMIAKKYGSSVKAICARNKISDPRKIRVGQVLVINATKNLPKTAETKVAPKTEEAPKNVAEVKTDVKVEAKPAAPAIVVTSDAKNTSTPAPVAPSVEKPAEAKPATATPAPVETIQVQDF